MANKVATFFNEIKLEMSKVSWTTKEEIVGSTIVVFISLGVLTFFIGVCDLLLSKLVNIIMTTL